MTPRQTFAIFCKSGYDVRACNPTREEIDAAFAAANAADIVATWTGAILKRAASKPKQDWQSLYDAAHKAGMEAVSKLNVVPMVVQQHANPLDDASPVEKSYFVADGVCGFAWVQVKPGNSPFAKWLKEKGLASADSYAGGVCIWVSAFNQSMQRKATYAYAFSGVLKQAGINSYASSRMD